MLHCQNLPNVAMTASTHTHILLSAVREPIRWREKRGNCHLCHLQGIFVWHCSTFRKQKNHIDGTKKLKLALAPSTIDQLNRFWHISSSQFPNRAALCHLLRLVFSYPSFLGNFTSRCAIYSPPGYNCTCAILFEGGVVVWISAWTTLDHQTIELEYIYR